MNYLLIYNNFDLSLKKLELAKIQKNTKPKLRHLAFA